MNDMSGYLAASGQTGEDASGLAELQKLADLQARRETEVAEAELVLTKAKESLRDVAERLLPEAMDRVGMTEFSTSTGLRVKIKEDVRASIPKARESEAFQWLRDHNHGSLIKRKVTVEFGRGEDERAGSLEKLLAESGFEFDDKTSVNFQTLGAFVRESLAEGVELPMDVFGVHRQRKSILET